MLKFKTLLWVFTFVLNREIKKNPECAEYVRGKDLIFQIRSKDGQGRYFVIRDGKVASHSGLTQDAVFVLTFRNAARGFAILSAKDSKAAFLRGVGNEDLVLSGNFADIMWFQGLTDFLQPDKSPHPYERTAL